jgi:CheY-like chemotaxis protein
MLHIAYIESNPHYQFTFEQITVLLRARGYDNELAFYADPEAALAQLPLQRPEIVFLDVRHRTERRPSGLDLVRALRRHPLCQKMTIVGMADYAMPADRNAALAAGCSDFVPKPLRYQAIEDIVTQHVLQFRR